MASDINQIFISSSNIFLSKEDAASKKLPSLQKNQLIQATVVKNLSSRQSQLFLLGRKIIARTHTPLTVGDKILLRVVKSDPQPVFKIETSDQPPLKFLYNALKPLGRLGPFKHVENIFMATGNKENQKINSASAKTFETFVRLVQASALKSDVADPKILHTFIKNSGLEWEHKLFSFISNSPAYSEQEIQELINGDLKALSLKAAALSEVSIDAKSPNAFSEGVENLQLLNRSIFEESGRLLLHLPMLFDGNLKFGQLLLDLNAKEKSNHHDDRMLRISFLLELTQLGDFLADFSILKNKITGSFGVANHDIKMIIQDNITALESKLKSHGFEVYPIKCHVLGPETLAGTSLIEGALSGSVDGLLNIVI